MGLCHAGARWRRSALAKPRRSYDRGGRRASRGDGPLGDRAAPAPAAEVLASGLPGCCGGRCRCRHRVPARLGRRAAVAARGGRSAASSRGAAHGARAEVPHHWCRVPTFGRPYGRNSGRGLGCARKSRGSSAAPQGHAPGLAPDDEGGAQDHGQGGTGGQGVPQAGRALCLPLAPRHLCPRPAPPHRRPAPRLERASPAGHGR
mmetsp:Transcript_145095/g.404249  ORF Transcript_145095/g.404249 Transcript_145095/m.404249 type:complete len:204 (-) Transcript_145095:1041-1652(-)